MTKAKNYRRWLSPAHCPVTNVFKRVVRRLLVQHLEHLRPVISGVPQETVLGLSSSLSTLR